MNINIARAWKDAEYRKTLSADELALLPENPVGAVEIAEDEAGDIMGMTSNCGGSNTCCVNLSICLNSVLCSVICL
ncbi:MAG TPA: mersacidin/lichenicidin family type 2 lantibiotic [Ktedonobacteraceae bacterium]|jgi:mersacidin/lichenicidin family type 2 lantibiotic|nr:mersacidin/lichenicidin family type 2 lantibiotic [Ktedonobacteraceae bacterium]